MDAKVLTMVWVGKGSSIACLTKIYIATEHTRGHRVKLQALENMRAFEASGISAAANKSDWTTGTLSRAVADLEDHF